MHAAMTPKAAAGAGLVITCHLHQRRHRARRTRCTRPRPVQRLKIVGVVVVVVVRGGGGGRVMVVVERMTTNATHCSLAISLNTTHLFNNRNAVVKLAQ